MSSDRVDALTAESPNLDDASAVAEGPGDFAFEAMGLKVGNRLQVQMPARLLNERSLVRLIGYFEGQSLLISSPKNAQGMAPALYEGEKLVMRAFSGQNAFAFASNILRVCKMPYNYLHLSFPESIQGAVIRKAPRVRTKITAQLRFPRNHNLAVTGVISNLSANGALLDAPRTMAGEGDRFSLEFKLRLHDVENTLALQAVVRAVLDDEKLRQSGSTLGHFGLEFVELQPNEQMLLKSMVYQKIIEDPQSMT